MVDFIARQRHWIDHLAPVWKAHPDPGGFYTTPELVEYAESLGVTAAPYPTWPKFERHIVVAAESDRNRVPDRSVILFQHGVGFSFNGGRHERRIMFGGIEPIRPVQSVTIAGPQVEKSVGAAPRRSNPSYAGAPNQRNVTMFVNPNRYPHEQWQRVYPGVRSEIVGTPKLDAWHNKSKKRRAAKPVVCISFHWDCTVAPETRWAFQHFRSVLPRISEREDIRVIAHAHPRAQKKLQPYWEKLGVEYVENFDEVLRRADLYVNDSSSTLYEFASTRRPVVVMNAPWFRRDVHHGLRFWEHSQIGPVANQPWELSGAITRALETPDPWQDARDAANAELYPYRGHAAERAVEVIQDHIEGREALAG